MKLWLTQRALPSSCDCNSCKPAAAFNVAAWTGRAIHFKCECCCSEVGALEAKVTTLHSVQVSGSNKGGRLRSCPHSPSNLNHPHGQWGGYKIAAVEAECQPDVMSGGAPARCVGLKNTNQVVGGLLISQVRYRPSLVLQHCIALWQLCGVSAEPATASCPQ